MEKLVERHGTKAAAIISYIKFHLVKETDPRFIIFSQWHTMLNILRRALDGEGIKSVEYCGTPSERARALQSFATKDHIRVTLLSRQNHASGTNMQMANHIIIVETMGNHASDAAAWEIQAIERSVRLGQTRLIRVAKFLVQDSIEELLFNEIKLTR